MNEVDLSGAAWRTSSYSANGESCVEVAPVAGGFATRDSKYPAGGVLQFTASGWGAFLKTVKDSAST